MHMLSIIISTCAVNFNFSALNNLNTLEIILFSLLAGWLAQTHTHISNNKREKTVAAAEIHIQRMRESKKGSENVLQMSNLLSVFGLETLA